MGRGRVAITFWVTWLSGCTYPLVQAVPSVSLFRPDIPGGGNFPSGTRGMVVARDTVWVGDLRWQRDTLILAGIPFPVERVDCLSYRFPPGYMPPRLLLEGLAGAAVGVGLGVVPWKWLPRCPKDAPWCGIMLLFVFPVYMSASIGGFLMALYSLGYPYARIHNHLFRYAFSPDPVQQARCAEVLHFYNPLLDSTGTFVIPLREER